MVELALNRLSEGGIVELDEERKAAMVSNLMVVLCGDQPVQWCYIRVGTSIPIKSSARVSCAR